MKTTANTSPTFFYSLSLTCAILLSPILPSQAQGPGAGGRGRGMPAEAREAIHGLFDAHDKIVREVTVTDDGYTAKTTSKDPEVVKILHKHVKQMDARMKKGLMVRRWDPAYAEFVEHYDDLRFKIVPTDDGLTVTTSGTTDAAKAVARNHASIISKFVEHGWEEHDKRHPAVIAADGATTTTTSVACEKCGKSCPHEGAPCLDCSHQEVEEAKLGTTKPVHRMGSIYLSGQPGKDDIAEIASAGIKTVINLRHSKEMTEFDEKAAVEAAGLTYTHLPWKAPDELTDEIFNQTRKLLSESTEPVLLHCGSSNRAGAVWLPWQVLDQGLPLEEAVEAAKKMGLKSDDYEAKARAYIERNLKSKVSP